jgi:hypothetical protein
LFDVIVGNGGGMGEVGDYLCYYVYPATGVPGAATRTGRDSAGQSVSLTCEGCAFVLDLSHGTGSGLAQGIANGQYCDIWGYPEDWAFGFPYAEYTVAFHPSFTDPNDPGGSPAPAALAFYDGLGSEVYEGTSTEIPAQWYRFGSAERSGTSFSWENPIRYYTYFELGYYE